VHINNFRKGKTTSERFAKKATSSFTSSMSDESSMIETHAKDSVVGSSRSGSLVEVDDHIETKHNAVDKKKKKKKTKPCCYHCRRFAFNKRIPTQSELFALYTKQYASTLNEMQSNEDHINQ
jgi:hypothetical protein